MLLLAACALCHRPGRPVCPACLAASGPAPDLAPPPGVDACVAALDYHLARPLITSLKNGNRRDLVAPLAELLAAAASPAPGTVVTWAPTTGARRRARGYDQAELLARALARRWQLPCRGLLRRSGGTAQAGQGAATRWANPTFRVQGVVASPVVLVDDVATTGATLGAAARALRGAGATSVQAVVVARA